MEGVDLALIESEALKALIMKFDQRQRGYHALPEDPVMKKLSLTGLSRSITEIKQKCRTAERLLLEEAITQAESWIETESKRWEPEPVLADTPAAGAGAGVGAGSGTVMVIPAAPPAPVANPAVLSVQTIAQIEQAAVTAGHMSAPVIPKPLPAVKDPSTDGWILLMRFGQVACFAGGIALMFCGGTIAAKTVGASGRLAKATATVGQKSSDLLKAIALAKNSKEQLHLARTAFKAYREGRRIMVAMKTVKYGCMATGGAVSFGALLVGVDSHQAMKEEVKKTADYQAKIYDEPAGLPH